VEQYRVRGPVTKVLGCERLFHHISLRKNVEDPFTGKKDFMIDFIFVLN